MKAYGGMAVEVHIFLTSELLGASGQLHSSAALPPGKGPPCSHWIGDWVDPRAGLVDVEERKHCTLPGFELRPLSHPARRQSLYRVRNPGMLKVISNDLQ
jgi:hypothetical protein